MPLHTYVNTNSPQLGQCLDILCKLAGALLHCALMLLGRSQSRLSAACRTPQHTVTQIYARHTCCRPLLEQVCGAVDCDVPIILGLDRPVLSVRSAVWVKRGFMRRLRSCQLADVSALAVCAGVVSGSSDGARRRRPNPVTLMCLSAAVCAAGRRLTTRPRLLVPGCSSPARSTPHKLSHVFIYSSDIRWSSASIRLSKNCVNKNGRKLLWKGKTVTFCGMALL